MPRLSAFTPMGALRMSSATSSVEVFYNLLAKLYGAGIDSGDVGTYQEAKRYALARMLSLCLGETEHAGNQGNAQKVYDLLPLQELDYQLVPGSKDTVTMRRQALAAIKLLPRGSVVANMVNALLALLGPSLFAYLPAPAGAGSVVSPASPGVGPGAFRDVRIPARTVQLVDPVTVLYTLVDPGPFQFYVPNPVWCSYQNLDPSNPSATKLVKGDVVVVDGGNTSRMEKVTVIDVTDAPDIGAATQGFPAFLGAYFNPHDIGAPVSTGNFPYWWSTRRLTLLVVDALIAADRPTRAKVDALLAKLCKGVEQWAIVEPTSRTSTGGTVGPLTVGAPMGCTTIGALAYTNSAGTSPNPLPAPPPPTPTPPNPSAILTRLVASSAVVSGGNVTTLPDIVGSNHFPLGLGSAVVPFNASSANFNGAPTFTLDGAAAYLACTSFSWGSSPSIYFVWAVYRLLSGGSYPMIWSDDDFELRHPGSAGAPSCAADGTTDYAIWGTSVIGNSNAVYVYDNGTQGAVNVSNGTEVHASIVSHSLPATSSVCIGARPGPSFLAHAEIAEIIVYKSMPSGADLAALQTYAHTVYGV